MAEDPKTEPVPIRWFIRLPADGADPDVWQAFLDEIDRQEVPRRVYEDAHDLHIFTFGCQAARHRQSR